MLTEFGKAIRIIRMNSGDTASEMSKKLYISPSYLYLIENGKRRIPKDMEINIANAYNLSDEDKKILHSLVMAERTQRDEQIDSYINHIENTSDSAHFTYEKGISLKKKQRKNTFWIILISNVVLALIIILIVISLMNKKANESNLSTNISDKVNEYVTPEIPTEPTSAEMFEYEDHDGNIYITKYIGNDKSILIPSQIDDKPVSHIAERAFYENETVKSIVVQNGVEMIEFEAFARCVSLEYVQIPDSVTYLGNGAFIYCYSLKKADLGNGISILGQCLFSFCYDLREVTMGKYVCIIEHDAFSDCYSLESISLPENLREIKYAAFHRCKLLEEVILPNKLSIIGDNPFCECIKLKKLFIPSGVTEIGNELLMGCNDATIYCLPGSYAEKYAKDNGYKYKIISDAIEMK